VVVRWRVGSYIDGLSIDAKDIKRMTFDIRQVSLDDAHEIVGEEKEMKINC